MKLVIDTNRLMAGMLKTSLCREIIMHEALEFQREKEKERLWRRNWLLLRREKRRRREEIRGQRERQQEI